MYIVFDCDGSKDYIYLLLQWVSIVSGKGSRSQDQMDTSIQILTFNAPQDSV